MIEERLKHLFAEGIESQMAIAEELIPSISTAALKLVNCLLADGTIYLCGVGASHMLCQYFSSIMMHPALTDRPSLPVVALSLDGFIPHHVGLENPAEGAFSRQVQALGHANDCLIVLSTIGPSPCLTEALTVAKEKEMTIIALSGRQNNFFPPSEEELHMEICFMGEHVTTVHQAHFSVLNSFAMMLDEALFGLT